MAEIPNACFVVNPHSAGGRTREQWRAISRRLTAAFGQIAVRFTQGPGDATFQTKQALEEGYDLIVSVGGDGTNNEVINGFFAADGTPYREGACFAFYPSASGGDLRRTLQTATSVSALIALLERGETRAIDLGRISFLGNDGVATTRYFVNVASFGISAEVNRRVSESSKPLGGTAAFFMASLRSILSFKNPSMTLSWDDQPPHTAVCHLVAVANGRYFGGGMKVAPDARIDDGELDLVIMGDMSRTELLLNGSKIYTGAHLQHKKAAHRRIKKLTAESPEEVYLDIDGETPGRLPATFEILPGHLLVRTLPDD